MPMLPDERFGNRQPNTGARPLAPPVVPPVVQPVIPPVIPGGGGVPPVITPTPGLGYVPPGHGDASSADVSTLPPDQIGDIPPPPVPAPPITSSSVGSGSSGITGTFARPGTQAAAPFRSAAYTPKPQQQRFGPGVANVGGDSGVQGLGLDPEQAAEILRNRAAGRAF